MQVCAVLPATPYTHTPIPVQNEPVVEFDRTRNPLRDDLLNESFILEDGYLQVPTGPGLGVTVDMDVVARYRVA
jgi:D-galactarolactone cycloisomerase